MLLLAYTKYIGGDFVLKMFFLLKDWGCGEGARKEWRR